MGYYRIMRSTALMPAALAAAAVLGAAGPGFAQAVRGVVTDDDSSLPVAEASVSVIGTAGAVAAMATSDSLGRFFMPLPHAGSFTLRVTRVGYRELVEALPDVPAGVEISVHIRISAAAVVLDPIRVTGRREFNAMLMRGYYERAARRGQRGDGRFLMREQLDRMVVSQTSDYLRQVPSVQLRPVQRGGRTQYPVVRRFGTLCEPAVWLNGNRISGQDMDTFIVPGTLEGIEIYTQGDEPVEYWDRSGCGVILLWSQSHTRHGAPITWRRVLKFGGLVAGFGALFLVLN
jgi:hypothetical protein